MWANILLTSFIVLLTTIHDGRHEVTSDESHLTSSGSDSVNLLRQEFTPQLKADYMKSNAFFQRWLKFNDFDVPKTRRNLQKFIDYRQKNLFGKQRRDLSAEVDIQLQIIKDKLGNPVVYMDMSKINLHKVVKEDLIEQFLDQIMETVDKACEFSYAHHQAEGNVSHIGYIVDWTGFNREEHLCPRCFPVYLEIVKKYEANYPLTVDRPVYYNTPEPFKDVIASLKPFTSKSLFNSYVVFGTDQQNSAKRYLEDWIGKANLPSSIRM